MNEISPQARGSLSYRPGGWAVLDQCGTLSVQGGLSSGSQMVPHPGEGRALVSSPLEGKSHFNTSSLRRHSSPGSPRQNITPSDKALPSDNLHSL